MKRRGKAGSHILKLPTTRHPDLVLNEFTGVQLCKAVELDCVNASVITRVTEADYGLNRAIDKTVRAFTWDDLDALLGQAGVLRRGRIVQVAKTVAAQAKADWPALLKAAPASMRRAITERLAGGVALASG